MQKGRASTKVTNGQRQPKAKKPPATLSAQSGINKRRHEETLDLDIDAFISAQDDVLSVETLLSGTASGQLRAVSNKKKNKAAITSGIDRNSKSTADDDNANDTMDIDGGVDDDNDDDFDAEEMAEMKAYQELQKEKKAIMKEAMKELKAAERLLTEGPGAEDENLDSDDDDDDDDDNDDGNGNGVATQKIFKNDKAALLAKLDQIRIDNKTPNAVFAWTEFQRITSTEPLALLPAEVENDLKREMAFYKQALEAAQLGYMHLRKANVSIHRPDDFYAEMIKSDEHMNKIRQKLVDEANAIAASERAKKLRDAKKFGKKVQVEKLQERQATKRQELEQVAQMRKKTSSGKNNDMSASGFEDDFGVSVDKEHGEVERKNKRGSSGVAGKQQQSVNHKRANRDHKFGFGGKKRHTKSNTADSTADMTGFNAKRMKNGGGAFKAKGGGVSKGANGGQKRPGKSALDVTPGEALAIPTVQEFI
ncbi:rRNA-processing protein and EBNA1-binding protein ebp2 [Physocladia obscura]|uniref:rRNA-processing protein and EBNA1-binding protein ebp2 n=1 Tax=Physocladia obscura TaxID=109957 RepID=A0AAD5ST92_9FUNG|nr:rRNA-processing protein and EBNA1-binding protein ebp2 [Physocladia obscura]